MGRRRIRTAVTAVAVSATLLMGGGVGEAAVKRVKAKPNNTWRKLHTYAKKRDKIVWKNPTSAQHDVTFYRGSKWSRQLPPGSKVKKRFKKKKTYLYRCVIHSGIVGGKCQGMCGYLHIV